MHRLDCLLFWPRMISTWKIGGEHPQILVNNKRDALKWYRATNLLDCRISAYPRYTDYYIDRTGIAPSLLHVDIDRLQFETVEQFELASAKTRTNFQKILGSQPTQLWTGRGHHYIQPQKGIVFEKIEDFKKFDQPSRRFMGFEERLITDNKADENHSHIVSFHNCMLRIPGSLNSRCVLYRLHTHRLVDPHTYTRITKLYTWRYVVPAFAGKLLVQSCVYSIEHVRSNEVTIPNNINWLTIS